VFIERENELAGDPIAPDTPAHPIYKQYITNIYEFPYNATGAALN
jgi:hypothetical protein